MPYFRDMKLKPDKGNSDACSNINPSQPFHEYHYAMFLLSENKTVTNQWHVLDSTPPYKQIAPKEILRNHWVLHSQRRNSLAFAAIIAEQREHVLPFVSETLG
jgi:hypothetical protein